MWWPLVRSGPYVTVLVAGAKIGSTFVITESENPVWMQPFRLPVAHYTYEVQFIVKRDRFYSYRKLGAVGVPAENLMSGERIEGWFPILMSNVDHQKAKPLLSLSIRYTPVDRMDIYSQGAGMAVPDTYFPERIGGQIKLYQDAHVNKDSLPNVYLDGGDKTYEHGQCWHDIYNAIREARHLIYITGWSVYHLLSLVRDTGNSENYKLLGDLLKEKSKEDVKVLLLVWHDPSALNMFGYELTGGMMGTGAVETQKIFRDSLVKLILCRPQVI
ncbi:unnamed protein product [Rhodiola kirilowii]